MQKDAALINDINENLTSFDEVAKRYEPLIDSESERAVFDEFKKKWGVVRGSSEKVIAMVKQGDSERASEEVTRMLRPAVVAAREVVDKLAKIQADGTEKGLVASSHASDNVKMAALISMGLTFVCGLIGGFAVVRSIAKPVQDMTALMGEMAKGSLIAKRRALSARMRLAKWPVPPRFSARADSRLVAWRLNRRRNRRPRKSGRGRWTNC